MEEEVGSMSYSLRYMRNSRLGINLLPNEILAATFKRACHRKEGPCSRWAHLKIKRRLGYMAHVL